jgi:hypothetical protein
VTLLAALALPLTVERVEDWADVAPGRLAVAAAEAALTSRALPLAPAALTIARPDLWGSETAAKRSLAGEEKGSGFPIEVPYRETGPLSGLVAARYRKPAARRWSDALVPAEGGRAALEAIVGELQPGDAGFGLVPVAAVPIAVEAPPDCPALQGPAEPPAASLARLFVMGEDPPFHDPFAGPPIRSPTLNGRALLTHWAARLEAVRPPFQWGEPDFDPLRVETWQARCAEARRRHWRPLAALRTENWNINDFNSKVELIDYNFAFS